MNIPLNLVINQLSFGQVSTCILKELYSRKSDVLLSLISDKMDFSSEDSDAEEGFLKWIEQARIDFLKKHDRNNKIFKLWHLNGSMESLSKEQVLFSFYELDDPTENEINIVRNNHKVLFSSEETVNLFRDRGCDNVHYVPLGFDKYNFHRKDKEYFKDDRIVFTILGKFEKRKHHLKVIQAWAKKYGNKKEYALQCALWNPFLSPEQNNQAAVRALDGERYFNINFMGFMQKNSQYNDFLNSSDVVLAMSGGEGWGLPEFHTVAIGKHAVVLNASAYKGWANEENSVLVDSSFKTPANDNVFFGSDTPFNQGNIYDFHENLFIEGCEKVIERVRSNRVNEAGLKLQEEFTYAKTVDAILDHMK